MRYSTFIKFASLAAFFVAASNVVAAGPSATLQVKGTITPAACTPTLSNGGIIDFGATSSSEITGDKLLLAHKVVQLSVNCSGATKMSFNLVDNRSGTVVPGISNFPVGMADFGLGKTTDDKNIGTYVLHPGNVMIDEIAGNVLGSSDQTTWQTLNTAEVIGNSAGNTNSFISVTGSEGTEPVAFTNMSMELSVFPFLSGEMKNITELQNLDGNATLNFDYL